VKDQFSVRGSRFSVGGFGWVGVAVLRREIHVSHPLHRTQRMGHPGFLVIEFFKRG